MLFLKPTQRGFTLTEVMVSMTILATVLTIASGSFLIILNASRQAQNNLDLINNLTFAIDSMTREIRTGYGYYCADNKPSPLPKIGKRDDVQDCATGGQFLSVIEAGGTYDTSLTKKNEGRIHYYLDSNQIIRQFGDNNQNNTNALPISPKNIKISTLRFTVSGAADRQDSVQPTVSIFLEGVIDEGKKNEVEFFIQTSVTQRLLDLS